jgi:hypothetical protein
MKVEQTKGREELWEWIDEKSSFIFRDLPRHQPPRGDARTIDLPILIEEKQPVWDGHKVAVHLDGGVTLERLESYPAPAEQGDEPKSR